jgi:hypothetical protein
MTAIVSDKVRHKEKLIMEESFDEPLSKVIRRWRLKALQLPANGKPPGRWLKNGLLVARRSGGKQPA